MKQNKTNNNSKNFLNKSFKKLFRVQITTLETEVCNIFPTPIRILEKLSEYIRRYFANIIVMICRSIL